MFASIQSFLWFFIPAVVLILTGICFEEKLIAFEQRIFHASRKRHSRQSTQAPVLRKAQSAAQQQQSAAPCAWETQKIA